MASAGMIRKNRPISMRDALRRSCTTACRCPGRRTPSRCCCVAEAKLYSISDRPCGPGLIRGRRLRASPTPRRTPATRAASPGCTATTSFISVAWIFLPRYSGVRPTIRPAMNTASRALMQDAHQPDADAARARPRRASCAAIGTIPPSGVNESCMQLTDAVRRARRRAGPTARRRPRRSGPPCPPCCRRTASVEIDWSTPSAVSFGLPFCSANIAKPANTTRIPAITASSSRGLALVADHLAERHDERERDQQDGEDLEHVGDRRWGSRTGGPSWC